MRSDDAVNVVGARYFNKRLGLEHVDSVEVFKQSKIVDGRFFFKRKLKLRTNNRKISLTVDSLQVERARLSIYLSEKKDFFAFPSGTIDTAIMSGCLEVEFW